MVTRCQSVSFNRGIKDNSVKEYCGHSVFTVQVCRFKLLRTD